MVGLVSVGVQAGAIGLVLAEIPQLNSVPAQQDIWLFERDALVLKYGVNRHMLIVDGELANGERVAVEEELICLRLTVDIEIDDRISQIVLALSECQLKIILDV